MSTQVTEPAGWAGTAADNEEVIALRERLQRDNGIKGLELLTGDNVERIVQLFHRDGFVLVENILNAEQVAFLAQGCAEVIQEIVALDQGRQGNRGSHRYSFGGSSLTRSQLHRPEWQMLLQMESVHTLVTHLFGSPHFSLRAASGDFCLPGAVDYQRLHSDVGDWVDDTRTRFSAFHDPLGEIKIRDLPCPYICVNFLPQDVTRINGPTRQIPGTQKSRTPIPSLADEPEWMRLSTVCPAPAGSIMIRDVRAWHGGTPNLSDHTRAIPNLEFYAPWFREPVVPGINRHDYEQLSPRAQELARDCVADSGVELQFGATLQAP
ncbi:MAG: phytanoyl-CoA dioxygenase family protein [Pseudomonadota bacterium]